MSFQQITILLLGQDLKFVGEIYYKSLKDVIPYEIDNLRIRYLPSQSAKGYTTGLDLRVNGEFVPGRILGKYVFNED